MIENEWRSIAADVNRKLEQLVPLTPEQKAGLIRLADLMEAGSKHYGEIHRTYIYLDFYYHDPNPATACGCALGTAGLELKGADYFRDEHRALTQLIEVMRSELGLDIIHLEIPFPEACRSPIVPCIVGWQTPLRLEVGYIISVVNHLHNEHKWTREAVAAYLRSLGTESTEQEVVAQ